GSDKYIYIKAKVSLMEMVTIHHISTQGSPESKSAGGGYDYSTPTERRGRPPRRHRTFDEEFEDRFEEYQDESNFGSRSKVPVAKNYDQIKNQLLGQIIGQNEIIEEMVNKMVRRDFKLSTDKKKPLSFFWA